MGMARAWWPTAVALVLVTVVAGCSSRPSAQELSATQLTASSASAKLVVHEYRAGHVTAHAAGVGLSDATREVASAARSLIELEVTGAAANRRDELVEAAALLSRCLHAASEAIGRGAPLKQVQSELTATTDQLRSLERRVAAS